MTEPAEAPAELPRVSLAGQDWPIPELLPWTALSRCRARILELSARMDAAVAAVTAAPAESPGAATFRRLMAQDGVFGDLTDDDYERLVVDVLHAGLAALTPTLSREAFATLATTEVERQRAWYVLRKHSGLFLFRDAGDEPPPGETDGAA